MLADGAAAAAAVARKKAAAAAEDGGKRASRNEIEDILESSSQGGKGGLRGVRSGREVERRDGRRV